MKEASRMSNPQTSKDLSNVTFLQALEAGLTHSGWLIGEMTDQPGQAHALASHSVSPARAKELTILATYGPLFGGSSHSADLQQCLESRLRRKMDVNGSPEYALTWKQWDIGSGLPICALRASGLHISGKGYGGWPTATPRDHKDGTETSCQNVPANALLGRMVHEILGTAQFGGHAKTEDHGGYLLNFRFALWLQGYPEEWASCGERAMRLSRKSRKSS